MTEGGKRPGGLTALAVFNFIGCGIDLLGLATMAFVLWVLSEYPPVEAAESDAPPAKEATADEEITPEEKQEEAWQEIADESRRQGLTKQRTVVLMVLGAALATLLLLSGIGYLQQKRFLGRTLGMVYAVLSLATVAFEISGMSVEVPRSQIIMAGLMGGIYPLITLLLLNTTFKEDFVR